MTDRSIVGLQRCQMADWCILGLQWMMPNDWPKHSGTSAVPNDWLKHSGTSVNGAKWLTEAFWDFSEWHQMADLSILGLQRCQMADWSILGLQWMVTNGWLKHSTTTAVGVKYHRQGWVECLEAITGVQPSSLVIITSLSLQNKTQF